MNSWLIADYVLCIQKISEIFSVDLISVRILICFAVMGGINHLEKEELICIEEG